MRRLFTTDDHAAVDYDRPNLPWVCGQATDGCPCPLGPTARGGCPEGPDCAPVRDGDHWRCGRPVSRGGPCDDETDGGGPTPDGECCRTNRCRPIRSLRRRRGRLAVGVAVFAAGALAMLIGSDWRDDVLAPGPLTAAHARLLTTDQPNRCAACHPGGSGAALGTAPGDAHHATQSQLCIECHRTLIDAEHALAAHSVSPSVIDSKQPIEGVACAACHQEHHGADHDLSAISDRRCQACHERRFEGFASDHPDFGNWPYRRRTRINFDHNAHGEKHFAGKGEGFACAACHVDSPQGDAKLTLGYDQACARCHDADIRASLAAGLPVLSLPTIDRNAVEDFGERLGAWPDAATGDFDGELPAIAKLLLAADPQAGSAIDRLGADFSFFDIDPDSREDVRDAVALAGALRSLVADLAEHGHEEILNRVDLLNCTGPLDCRDALPGAAPVALIDFARRAWFTDEVSPAADRSAIELAGRQTTGGWLLDDRGLALRYVPRGHADPLLQAWIELAASLGDGHAALRDAALAELAGPKSVGLCATCHSIEEAGGGALTVNWRSFNADALPRGFTRFSHRPHVTQPELADCAHCHRPDRTADRQAAPYLSPEPRDFVAQFEPIAKSSCVECHRPHAAGDGCTQCHNYHVDSPPGR